MDERKDTWVEALLEQLIEHGPNDMARVFAKAFELTMRMERERFLGAGPPLICADRDSAGGRTRRWACLARRRMPLF